MNLKSAFLVLTIFFISFSLIPASANGAQTMVSFTPNLLANGDFEDGNAFPANWLPDPSPTVASFSWDPAQSQQGSKSVKIYAEIPDDARWVQSVAVQPYTDYRLSGWIKTENVAQGTGASLSLLTLINNAAYHTPGINGTQGWTYVSRDFNSGPVSRILIAARLGFWGSESSGTAWFDNLKLEPVTSLPEAAFLPMVNNLNGQGQPCASSHPSWKILVLAYETTDFTFSNASGQHHFYASMTPSEKERISYVVNRFVYEDVPALDSCNMLPTVVIRYPAHSLSQLTPMSCNDYAPTPENVKADRDPAFDSVITIWDGSGTDLNTGNSMFIQGCAWAWGMGTGQTYDAVYLDSVHYSERNVFKHEWGHSITFYYDAAGTAPKPAVNNHINDTDTRYVNCLTGSAYILQDENDFNLIPNSIYNNQLGFTHDYYSGKTATADKPSRCLGITPSAWASGGPVTRPLSGLKSDEALWHSPNDDVITTAVPFR